MPCDQDVPALPCPFPPRQIHQGRVVRLDPLQAGHATELWKEAANADASWRFLRYGPFTDLDALTACIIDLAGREHQPFWAVRTLDDNGVKGWLSLCDIYPADGAIEIGSVWFSPSLQRTRAATEAVFLLMRHAFDDLGYRRLVWRCVAANSASCGAALRYGFVPEGIWREGIWLKGQSQDIAWHAMLRREWPARRAALTDWLDDANFDADGQARTRLARSV